MSPSTHVLPPLRPELRLTQAAQAPGAPAGWRLDDPVRQRSFLLASGDVDVLALWPLGSLEAIRMGWLQAFRGRTPEQFAAQFEGLFEFLGQNHLLTTRPGADTQRLMDAASAGSRGGLLRWVRGWMGWQLPLIRPQAWLNRAVPVMRTLCSPVMLALWALLTLLGLYLVSRQWDTFMATFTDFSHVDGWLTFGIALIGLKIVHEFGHAFAAAHHGALVPSMGLSVAFGVPMLYTDTSDVTRLARRSARLWVGGAGMLAETLVAGPCTLAWAVLPDGALRTTCFVIATSSWITTLAVNLNPFGRFDGYYMLSDALHYPNLQQRALEHAGWFVERLLFGPVHMRPSDAAGRRLVGLILFGTAVWLFRLSLGLGAAQLAYSYLFQLAGIALAALTLWWTVLDPLRLRARAWWRVRRRVPGRRWLGLGAVVLMIVALVGAPLDRHVDAAASLGWRSEQLLATPEVAVVEEVLVQSGAVVAKDQPLIRLRSGELARRRAEANAQEIMTRERLQRIAGDARDRSELLVLEQQQGESRAALRGIVEREKQLEIRATSAGRVVDLPPNLARGMWVRSDQSLGRVLEGDTREVLGYIDDAAVARLHEGANATFYADDVSVAPIALRLTVVEAAAAEQVTPEMLASVHGGPLPSAPDRYGRAVPRTALHRVRFAVPATAPPASDIRMQRGRVRIEAAPDSLGEQAMRRLMTIVLRELQG